jgi:Tfp pilus assembly protein PilO
MPSTSANYNYKQDYTRYRYYFGRIYQYYQKPVAKVSTALLLTIFTTIFFAVFAIRPTLITIAELLRKIEDQRATLTEMKKKAAALNTASQEYNNEAQTRERLNQAIPETDNVASLIKIIEGTAAQNGVAITDLSVQEYTYAPQKEVAKSTAEELEVSTTTTSIYPSLRQLIRDLFFVPRLIAIDNLTFTTKSENNAPETSSANPSVTIGSRTFILPKVTIQSTTTETETP